MAADSEQDNGPDPLLGTTIAERYRIDAVIGRGGMGNVYRATQLNMDRPVAIKVLQHRHREDSEYVERFKREMKGTASVEHANTVRVYDYGVTRTGDLFLVMEYLDGTALHDLVDAVGPLHPDRIAHIAVQVAGALAASHAQGIIHRDLKPENVVIMDRAAERDFVKVLDFGLAHYGDEAHAPDRARLTQSDLRVGTPNTMAPEYIQKGTIDSRADLYALGVVMYHMATGKPLFEGTPYEVLTKHVLEKPPSMEEVRGEALPSWLEQVVARLLKKRPDDRFATADEVRRLLVPHARRWIGEGDDVGSSNAMILAAGALVAGVLVGALLLFALWFVLVPS